MADRVAEIRTRLAAATPGPWEVEREELDARYFDDDEAAMAFPRAIGPLTVEDIDGDEVRIEANAALIAAAPADLEWACGEIERLTRDSDAKYDTFVLEANATLKDRFPATGK